MFKNYLRTAFRTLATNKLYTTLNVVGLAFGLSCFLLIGLYIFDELTFDSQHSNADRIYRVVEHKSVNGESTITAGAGHKLSTESKKQIPGIENVARVQRQGRANIGVSENSTDFFQETITIANKSFLEIFDFQLLAGDRMTALAEPNSIIISEALAMKLFNQRNVLGKTLNFQFINSPLKITAVFKNHPGNSSFQFNSLVSEATVQNGKAFRNRISGDWLSASFSIYALLEINSDPRSIAKKMTQIVHDNFTAPSGTNFYFSLQPLKQIHLHSDNIVDGARNANVDAIAKGDFTYIKIFAAIAIFVLLIAGINYMNLTTARTSSRLKEIGVRKTIGALKGNLIKQFLVESLLVTFISFLLSLIIVNLFLPTFNQFINRQLSLDLATDYRIWIGAISFAVLTSLFSGSYPALMLSGFKPVLLLKGLKLQNKSDLWFRKGLIVFQFAVSIVMIIATTVLFLQVRYLNNTNLGFNKELLVVIDVNTGKARTNFESIKANFAKIPTVKNVSATSRVPGEWKSFRTIKLNNSGSIESPKVSYMLGADKDFLNTYEISLLKGRNFATPADSADIMINETAAKLLGITEPAGQLTEISAISPAGDGNFQPLDVGNGPFRPRVIGIVKDFHFQSLRDKIEPLIVCYNQNPIQDIDYYSVKISALDIEKTVAKLRNVMIENDKSDPFEYHFLNDQLALFYQEDGRRQTILIWAALATIFIACLGLFGLSTYAAEKRVKEIGIRKVLGANVFGLASLLSADFLKLVLIANVIAFPIAWWAVNQWLQEYAYHIELQWWFFGLAGVAACLIAMLTISFHAFKAAISNPIKSLRTE